MKFRNVQDIEADIATVFAHVTDFDAFERAAMSRGADVVRLDPLTAPAPGMAWRVAGQFRGRKRSAEIELVEIDAPHATRFAASSPGYEMTLDVNLIELSPRRTRLVVELLVRPRSLGARIMLQSLQLARGTINRRFRARMRAFATFIEDNARLARNA